MSGNSSCLIDTLDCTEEGRRRYLAAYGKPRAIYLSVLEPLTAPVIRCPAAPPPGSADVLLVFHGAQCALWRPDNEYRCFWNATVQARCRSWPWGGVLYLKAVRSDTPPAESERRIQRSHPTRGALRRAGLPGQRVPEGLAAGLRLLSPHRRAGAPLLASRVGAAAVDCAPSSLRLGVLPGPTPSQHPSPASPVGRLQGRSGACAHPYHLH